MKVVFQIVRHGSLSREANPWFRPRESSGTGATGNGRVRSCRDNIAGVHSPRRIREMKASAANTKAAGQLDWRASPTQVNWVTHRDQQQRQRCCQASPKGKRPSCPPEPWGHTDHRAAGVDPGTNLVPSGKVEVRPVVTEQTPEQFDAMVHASVANLLAWRPEETPVAVSVMVSSWVVQTHPQPLQQIPWRMVLAHSTSADLASQMALELQAMYPVPILPWSQEMRTKFDTWVRNIGGVSRWDGKKE